MWSGPSPYSSRGASSARGCFALGPGEGVTVATDIGNFTSVAHRDWRFEEPRSWSDESADLHTLRVSASAAVGAPLY